MNHTRGAWATSFYNNRDMPLSDNLNLLIHNGV